jgi:hypothetical protein
MTMPPPPPDRMHLQYQPAPPPQPGQQMGPGGAYGPMQQPSGPPAAPERPGTRPPSVIVAAAAMWLLAAISAWGVVNGTRWAIAVSEFTGSGVVDALFQGSGLLPGVQLFIHAFILIGAAIAAPVLTAGKSSGRSLGIFWSVLSLLAIGVQLAFLVIAAVDGYFPPPLPGVGNPLLSPFAWAIGRFALALIVFILMFSRGARAWTSGTPSGPDITGAHMGHPGQQGPYGQQGRQSGQYGQQQNPYGRY